MDIRSTKAFAWWEKYEHHLGVAALTLGFLFDLWIAKRPDSLNNNILLLAYLFIAGGTIVVLNLRDVRRKEEDPEPLLLLLLLQFSFGGLASNLLILYGHSGTLAGSAVFIGLLGAMVLGNEFLRGRYVKLRFNIGVYYFLLLTYFVIAVPTFVTHGVGRASFLLSGFLSLLYIGGFLAILYYAVFRGDRVRRLYEASFLVVVILGVFCGLYFLNVIPPVPLSLKDIGIYHSILKYGDGGYLALYEPTPWWEFWRDTDPTYRLGQGQSAFCFSSIFAPADLSAPIYHKWEYKNNSEWEVRSRVSFPIFGGRDDGYRGFSVKTALTPGEWRCSVETAQGGLIGRIGFTVVTESAPPLSQKTL